MNFSPILFVFLWFFVLASSAEEETVIQKLNKEWLKPGAMSGYHSYLSGPAFIAASAGKNVFKMPESLSEDCVRTAKATFNLLATPTLWNQTKTILSTSVGKNIFEMKSGKNSIDPTELLCQRLNEEFKKNREFSNFEELKKNVDLPKPTKNYYIEVQPDKSVSQTLMQSVGQFNDPETVKFAALSRFQAFQYQLGAHKESAEFVGIGKAVSKLSELETFKTTGDSVFHQALEDFIKDVVAKHADSFEKMMKEAVSGSFALKVDEYYRKNAVLKEEYEKIKKEAVDDVNKNAKVF